MHQISCIPDVRHKDASLTPPLLMLSFIVRFPKLLLTNLKYTNFVSQWELHLNRMMVSIKNSTHTFGGASKASFLFLQESL